MAYKLTRLHCILFKCGSWQTFLLLFSVTHELFKGLPRFQECSLCIEQLKLVSNTKLKQKGSEHHQNTEMEINVFKHLIWNFSVLQSDKI